MNKQLLIDKLANEHNYKGARDYYLDDEERATIVECIGKQIPKKVEWTPDHTWGVEKEVPVCPTCDYYLTPIEFIDMNICERTGHCEFLKVSYCEHCSQAIDWSDNE